MLGWTNLNVKWMTFQNMPVPYTKKPRPLKMSNYDPGIMEEAIKACKEGQMSVRAAAQHYGLPKSTLQDRVSGAHGPEHGRPTALCKEEEEYIVDMVKQCSEWGFPFTARDLQLFIKQYLDRKGEAERFKNNMPTHGFVDSLLMRHKEIRLRKTSLIKRARAAVSVQEVEEFFEHFKKSAEGVAPENMFNYDESGFRDSVVEHKHRKTRFKGLCHEILKNMFLLIVKLTSSTTLLGMTLAAVNACLKRVVSTASGS